MIKRDFYWALLVLIIFFTTMVEHYKYGEAIKLLDRTIVDLNDCVDLAERLVGLSGQVINVPMR